jgi:hypothetical protein
MKYEDEVIPEGATIEVPLAYSIRSRVAIRLGSVRQYADRAQRRDGFIDRRSLKTV